MDFATRYGWSHEVHLGLGEQLQYYVVNFRPFRREEVEKNFFVFIKNSGLGSIRVYSIFGRHDVLVRAWLDPEAARNFSNWIQKISTGAVNAYPFVVTELMFRWTTPDEMPLSFQPESKKTISLLNKIIHKERIRSLETGGDKRLFEQLLERKLIFEHRFGDSAQRIQFFIAITPEDPTIIESQSLAAAIRTLAETEPAIERFTLDFGFGFCAFLCKGAVKVTDYFQITAFLRGITRLVPAWGITTETLLVNEERLIAGTECIGEATFNYIGGKDLAALQTIPELYSQEFRSLPDWSQKEKEIVTVLRGKDLSDEDRGFVHDYLLGVLKTDPQERFKSMAGFFIDLEYFLRANYQAFGGRLANGDLSRVMEKAKVKDPKRTTLGDILSIYSSAMEISGQSRFDKLVGHWEPLVQVRNEVVHGTQSFLDNWIPPLETVLSYLDRIKDLNNCIKEELKLI